VVDIGCGPLGGFVPMLRAKGYDAVGIDPRAPEEPHYRRVANGGAPVHKVNPDSLLQTAEQGAADPSVLRQPIWAVAVGFVLARRPGLRRQPEHTSPDDVERRSASSPPAARSSSGPSNNWPREQ